MFSDDSSANEGQDVDFVQTFFAWLNISGYREERRFLEAHPELATPESRMTQHNLGNAYRERVQGEPHANLEQALTCYQAALQVYTHDAFPAEYRLVQLNRAQAEARGGNWEQVHAAYAAACQAEDLLVALGAGTTGRDAILREGHDARTRDGFALVQLQRVAEAAVAIERGRARGLAEALAINAADPRLIGDKQRRTRYEHACEQFIAAQATLHAALPHHLTESERRSTILERSKAYQNAKACFDQVIAEIRAAQDPADFLVDSIDAATILRAAEYGGTGHALVYLAATPWGGTAVAALGTHASLSTPARFRAFGLPDLTDSFMGTLIEVRLDDDLQHIVGGFVQAQEGAGLTLINAQDWPGTTFREKAAAFSTACRVFGKTSTLVGAIDKVLSIDALTSTVNKPLDTLTRAEQSTLATTLNHYFLQQELERCLETLGKAALRPLITWLLEQGVTSLTLIPCGLLAAFPLLAVPLTDGRTVGETLLTSVAPNARQFLHQENTGTERVGIYAVGDPRPTHQVLEWSEAEACTLATLARHIGLVGQAKVQQQATLVWLRAALEQGYVVDISCHGVFDVDDFLQSALLLARNQRLYLRNLLSHEVDLRGLRLLILSACQTAISDLRSARDEVHSLAAGMLQAGARAVLASLWPVDDKATYLLIVRFAQEWLPNMHREPVAAALGRAQYWLRTVTNRDLQTWQATNAPEFLVESGQKIRSKRLNFNLWQQKESQLAGKGQLSAVRGRGYRYEPGQAENIVQASAIQRHSPDACPYAHPIYWAGFQIVGW